MSAPLRREVLMAFKNLHRARLTVFKGDDFVLKDARQKINEEFKKHKTLPENTAIHDLVEYANAVATELRTCVVQAVEKSPGVYELKVRPETHKLDNKPFDINEMPEKQITDEPCCQQTTPCCRQAGNISEAKFRTCEEH